jgi:hypothetical protein
VRRRTCGGPCRADGWSWQLSGLGRSHALSEETSELLRIAGFGFWAAAEVSTGLRLFQSGHFNAEAVFDELGVCDDQSVLGWQASIGPVGCLVARSQTAQFAEQTIP